MPHASKAADGRSVGLVLAALAAIGWGAAFYALSDNFETRAAMSRTIAALEAENARLAALVEADARLEGVEAQIRKAREELVATLDRRRDLEENIAALHTDLVTLDGSPMPEATGFTSDGEVPDGDQTQARASSLNAALARLDRTIAERSRDLTSLDQAREEAETRLNAASEEAVEIERRISARAEELRAAEQRLSSLLADVARLDRLNERRTADLEKLGEGEATAREQAETTRAELEGLAQRRAELASEVEALEASLAASHATRAEIAEQQSRLAGLREEAAQEEARLARTRRDLADLEGRIETSQAELLRLQEAARPAARAPSPVEDQPDGSRVIRVTPSFN